MNITYKEKDVVLNNLCSSIDVVPELLCRIDRVKFIKDTNLDQRIVYSILQYFHRIGLVSNLNYRYNLDCFTIIVRQEAFDIFNRGGFTMKEYLLKQEVEKLLFEIERLKPTFGDKIEQLSVIVANIASIIKPF